MPHIDIVLTADGQIGFYVQDGSFAEGKASIEALVAILGSQMPLTPLSEVESHRPNAEQIEQRQPHHTHLPGGPAHEH